MRIVYDCETYPNVFTLAAEMVDAPFKWLFEISEFRDDTNELIKWCMWLRESGAQMVGFNNVGFDYPILHAILAHGLTRPRQLYNLAQRIITATDSERRNYLIYASKRIIPQIDLYGIHNFGDKSRSTSLKMLEFAMRMDNIEDLPFPVGTVLTPEQVVLLKKYNAHDVAATKAFYFHTEGEIEFREGLTAKHNRDFMSHSDVAIGRDTMIMNLDKVGMSCYEYGPIGRQPKQTKREVIVLNDAIFPWVEFKHLELTRVVNWLRAQSITETKGVFKGLTATVNGFEFVFGTGGLHGSVKSRYFESDDTHMIIDFDVASFYPSLAIANRLFPQHLGEQFCDIYKDLRDERMSYKKGSLEYGMLKLSLNSVYGYSNQRFSVFYDPLYTMSITLNGQLLLCMLAEKLMDVPGVELIQANTDGMTIRAPRVSESEVTEIVAQWERHTKLNMERADYSRMWVRDVNSYIAERTDSKLKRKGAYEYKLEWHKNHSALVVAMAAEQNLVYGKPIRETVENHPDVMDFMICAKVPKSSKLMWGDQQVQNTCRYYVTKGGEPLTKIMPPLAKEPDKFRSIGVQCGWTVQVCNDIKHVGELPINFDYYVNEVEKLCLGIS